MAMTSLHYEIIDAVPATQITQKVIFRNNNWETVSFIRIPVRGVDRLARGKSDIENWCYEKYGNPTYLGPWCKVENYIIMEDKIYVHWKLCE